MNDITRIRFELDGDNRVKILAVIGKGITSKEILIGDIFSDKGSHGLSSYSGKNSIQICGFDNIKGPWSCGRFNHSQDCCLVWNDIEQFLNKKENKQNAN